MVIQNSKHTEYAYDTRNRLTEIARKDGSTVKRSFGYTLDDDGTITRITHEDGSYWDYDYDGRNRLISAKRDFFPLAHPCMVSHGTP